MEHYGILSILPPVLAIVLALRTRQVYVSLLMGIALGWWILSDWHPWQGFYSTVEGLVAVFESRGNTRTIMFSALVGSLIVLVQRSGGIHGFVNAIDQWMKKMAHWDASKRRRRIQLLAWLIGIVVFVETSISSLTVGTLFRPLFDRMYISREKLAYIADTTSAAVSILIPFNAWGAFIMGLLLTQGFEEPFSVMFRSMVYNFYPILALFLVPLLILSGRDFGPMAVAERRAVEEGKVLADGAKPLMGEEIINVQPIEGIRHALRNMAIPIGVMVGMMPVMLAVTGWEKAVEAHSDAPLWQLVFYAIGKGSGSTAVLLSVIFAILTAVALYRVQRIIRGREAIDLIMKGISHMMPLALLMLFAFAIGAVCKHLGTGLYAAEITQGWLMPQLVPAVVFAVSAFVAFATGTSWGTFAIMIPVAVPMAQALDAHVYMTIAAVLGGGVFGDHSSPISDTTIISSMASASDHIDHVRTQLPYALTAATGAILLYIALGFFL